MEKTPVPPMKPHTREWWCVCGKPLVYRPDPVYSTWGWWCPDGYNCKGHMGGARVMDWRAMRIMATGIAIGIFIGVTSMLWHLAPHLGK